ncbi:putative membrane protein [Bradyrhizobium sp. AZCC 1708]
MSKLDSSSSMMMCGRFAVASQVSAGGSMGRPAACAPARRSGPFVGGSTSIHPVEASRDTATTPERAKLET